MSVRTQLNKGNVQRLMYFENKVGLIDGAPARIGWARFSKSGQSVFYRGRELAKIKGGGVRGNYMDIHTREEYWISGIKMRGSNVHPAAPVRVEVDEDALNAYHDFRSNISPEAN